MKKKLYIIGAGGFGREVLSIARDLEPHQSAWKIEGFLNSECYMDALDGINTDGYRICESIEEHIISNDNVYVFAIADVHAKEKMCTDFLNKGAQFINLIHPTARIGYTAKVGIGLIMAPFSWISENTEIGDFVTVNVHSTIGHDAKVEDYCTLSAHCDVTGHTILHKKVFLGSKASVCPHIEIGEEAYIGAGSIVIQNVKTGIKVFGNPAMPF